MALSLWKELLAFIEGKWQIFIFSGSKKKIGAFSGKSGEPLLTLL